MTSRSTHRTRLPVVAVVLTGLLWGAGSCLHRPKIENVLLISIDTLRADRLSSYGFPEETTPHIDQVAREGVMFKNVISPAPITLPSHSSMLTGTIPPYHGVHDNLEFKLDDSSVTLAEVLHEKGFTTGAIVSSIVLDRQFNLTQGFDTYDDRFDEAKTGRLSERKGGDTAREAMKWLEEHKDGPFFLFVHFYDPHQGYEPPEPFASRFANDSYTGEVAYVDRCVGEVLSKLKELGLYDSTLIVITADHGEMLGEHGEPTHGYFVYQSAIRIPLIFRAPGRGRPRVVDSLVGTVDIVPTICRLLGLDPPEAVTGESLATWIDGGEPEETEREIYTECIGPTRFYGANSLLSLVTKRWKYIQTTRPELYDLVEDPQESNDLYAEKGRLAQGLRTRLKEVLKEQTRTEDESQGKIQLDEDTRRRLESLGYFGGNAISSETFEFDQDKEDPKDLIGFFRKERKLADTMHDIAVLKSSVKEKDDAELEERIRKRYEDARNLCAELIEERPHYADTYLTLAVIATDQGRIEEAIGHYNEALEVDPRHRNALYNVGNLLRLEGRYDEAIRHFRRALEVKEDFPEAQRDLAQALGSQKRFDEAMEHFDRALELAPEDAETHVQLASTLASLGRLDEAVEHYRKALEIDPDSSDARSQLGYTLAAMGKADEALEEYRRALEEDPDSAEANAFMGTAMVTQGKYREAVPYLQKALRMKPDYAAVHDQLGVALREMGSLDEAAQHFRLAIRFDPGLAVAHHNLGMTLRQQGQIDAAIKEYRAALSLDPKLAVAHNNLGSVLGSQGKIGEAIRHFRQALASDPDYDEAHNNLGLALRMTGERDEALEHFRAARHKRPNWPQPMNEIAWILATHPDEAKRDPAEAVRLAERAAELTGGRQPVVLDTLAAAYAAAGDFDRAVAAGEKAVSIASSANATGLANEIRRRVDLYRRNTPYREPVHVRGGASP